MAGTEFDLPVGTRPVLQWCAPASLQIDPRYQRGMQEAQSIQLVARIARRWNWDRCQPLTVALRPSGGLFVIDGQHRLAAARRRGDISELPCVVVLYASVEAEAASFVAINQERKPLSKLDLFRAAVAGKNPRALEIAAALAAAGLSVARHSNIASFKPGWVGHLGGIERGWERHGALVSQTALRALGRGFPGQVLRFGGTLYRGIVRICVDEMKGGAFAPDRFERFIALLQSRSQPDWIKAEDRFFRDGDVLFRGQAIEELMRAEWSGTTHALLSAVARAEAFPRGEPVLTPKGAGFGLGASDYKGDAEWAWCAQCDKRRTKGEVAACASQFCKLRVAA